MHRFASDNLPALCFVAALQYAQREEEGTVYVLLALRRQPDFRQDLMGYPVDRLGLLQAAGSRVI